jgi:hypothetical protein
MVNAHASRGSEEAAFLGYNNRAIERNELDASPHRASLSQAELAHRLTAATITASIARTAINARSRPIKPDLCCDAPTGADQASNPRANCRRTVWYE